MTIDVGLDGADSARGMFSNTELLGALPASFLERHSHGRDGVWTLGGLFLQHLIDQRIEPDGAVECQARHAFRSLLSMQSSEFIQVARLKWRTASEHLKQHATESVDVRFRCHVMIC